MRALALRGFLVGFVDQQIAGLAFKPGAERLQNLFAVPLHSVMPEVDGDGRGKFQGVLQFVGTVDAAGAGYFLNPSPYHAVKHSKSPLPAIIHETYFRYKSRINGYVLLTLYYVCCTIVAVVKGFGKRSLSKAPFTFHRPAKEGKSK
jgi:hypothetical protein